RAPDAHSAPDAHFRTRGHTQSVSFCFSGGVPSGGEQQRRVRQGLPSVFVTHVSARKPGSVHLVQPAELSVWSGTLSARAARSAIRPSRACSTYSIGVPIGIDGVRLISNIFSFARITTNTRTLVSGFCWQEQAQPISS